MSKVKGLELGILGGFTIPMDDVSEVLHIGQDDLPGLESEDVLKVKLLRVDLDLGLWVVKTLWPAGYKV